MAPICDGFAAFDLSPRSFGLSGRGASMVIIDIVMVCAAIALVLNRFYVRFTTSKGPGSDDYVILCSLVFCIGMNVVNILGVNYGYGQLSSSIPKNDLHTSLKTLYKMTIGLTKMSILLLYRKIFDTEKFKFRLICDIVFVYVALYALGSTIATIFQCNPIAKTWNKALPGTCINLTAFWYANAASNIITDLIILCLPMPVIKMLRLPVRQRIALTMVFALGVFVCGTSIARMVTLDLSSKSLDANQGTMISTMWTTIEANTAIICACLPMLRIPLSKLMPNLFPSFHYSETDSIHTIEEGNSRVAAGVRSYSRRSSKTAVNSVEMRGSQQKCPFTNILAPAWG
ncbi:hypothetical protein FQN57_006242 [Myotisia sp. PD_48]|nr:hypothetical protein FQN57_006242 [Myotisia sp. PD_48]